MKAKKRSKEKGEVKMAIRRDSVLSLPMRVVRIFSSTTAKSKRKASARCRKGRRLNTKPSKIPRDPRPRRCGRSLNWEMIVQRRGSSSPAFLFVLDI